MYHETNETDTRDTVIVQEMSENRIENGEVDEINRGNYENRNNGDRQMEILKSVSFLSFRKKFYVDLKKIERGLLLKIAHVDKQRQRNRVSLIERNFGNLLEHVDMIIREHLKLSDTSENDKGNKLFTATFFNKRHRFYLDLMKGMRGRYMRITQVVRNDIKSRLTITIPMASVDTLKRALIDVLIVEGYPKIKDVLLSCDQSLVVGAIAVSPQLENQSNSGVSSSKNSQTRVRRRSNNKSSDQNSSRRNNRVKNNDANPNKSTVVCSETLKWDKRVYKIHIMQDQKGRFIRITHPISNQYLTLPLVCTQELSQSLERLIQKQSSTPMESVISNTCENSEAVQSDNLIDAPLKTLNGNDSAFGNGSLSESDIQKTDSMRITEKIDNITIDPCP